MIPLIQDHLNRNCNEKWRYLNFLSLLLISVYFYLQSIEIFDYSYLIPLSILLVVGLYDDIYEVDFKLKFLFQIITAKIMIDNGLIIDNFHGILGLYELNKFCSNFYNIYYSRYN